MDSPINNKEKSLSKLQNVHLRKKLISEKVTEEASEIFDVKFVPMLEEVLYEDVWIVYEHDIHDVVLRF